MNICIHTDIKWDILILRELFILAERIVYTSVNVFFLGKSTITKRKKYCDCLDFRREKIIGVYVRRQIHAHTRTLVDLIVCTYVCMYTRIPFSWHIVRR